MLSYPQRPNCLKQSHWGLDFSIQATIGHQHSSHSNLHSCSTKGQSQGFPKPFLQHHHCNLQLPRQWSFHALVFCSFINFTRESRVVSRSILLPRTLKGAQVKPLFTEKLKAAASIGPLGCFSWLAWCSSWHNYMCDASRGWVWGFCSFGWCSFSCFSCCFLDSTFILSLFKKLSI